ncbi:MAG: putative lipid II flippase FtsW [Acidobacteria bacterium]|nr:putative lipid II flippase FtsW [Acidobacteriota bacterium]
MGRKNKYEDPANRRLRLITDRWIFGITLVLVIFGVLMVYSASAMLAAEKFESQTYFLSRQAAWAAIGLVVMVVTLNIDYHFYQKPWVVFPLLAVCMVSLIAVFFMPPINNAHRWLHWRSFNLQPSEFAKLGLMFFIAYWLCRQIPDRLEDFWKTFFPAAAVTAVMMGLVAMEPDLGMALSVAFVMLVLMFAAGIPLRQMATLGIAAVPALYYLLFHVSWRMERMLVFIDPWKDPQGRGFQSIQSMIAIGSGGFWGTGFARGRQKLFYLPEPHTDFIFAEVGEELGLLGVVTLAILFAVFFYRGLRIALRAPDSFGMLLGIGVASTIVLQALFNMSVTVGLLPVKGMPLPLVSYGGSSMLLTLTEIGILLNIAQQAKRASDN